MSYPHPHCERCKELEAEYKTLEVLYKVACQERGELLRELSDKDKEIQNETY